MSTLKVNEVRHISNTGTANVVLESNENTNLQTTSTKGLSVDGTLTVTGVATLNGNTVIGNASTDTMTLTSTVKGFSNFSGFTGEIRMYAGNAAGNAPPAGWLYCNGDTVSETSGDGGTHYNADGKLNDYQALFNLLKASSDWGNSSSDAWGTDTVKTPDFRSRTPVGIHTGAATAIGTGSDSAALTARTLGDTTGAENHILVTNEIPAHLHGATSVAANSGVTASLAAITATVPNHDHALAHTHTTPVTDQPVPANTTAGTSHGHAPDAEFDNFAGKGANTTDGSVGMDAIGAEQLNLLEVGQMQMENAHTHPMAHTHAAMTTDSQSVSTTTSTTNPSIVFNSPAITIDEHGGHSHTIATTNTGGGLKHQNLSPIIAVNYIIKV